ncbi:MAG: hypothetical protein HQK51_05190 [Oligoflexia bacterium]|nr:hypothetical protein [Oligoflexia bacterium]
MLFSNSKSVKVALLSLLFSSASSFSVLADNPVLRIDPIRPIRPIIPIATIVPIIPINHLEFKPIIAKPIVVRPISRHLPSVAPEAFGPDTHFTLGLYDKDGNIDGQKEMTGKELWNELNKFTSEQKNSFAVETSRLAPAELSNIRKLNLVTAVQEKKAFDQELNQEIEVVEIPQDIQVSRNLTLQFNRLVAIPLLPIRINPIPVTRPSQPSSLKASYDQVWGNTSLFAAYIEASLENYGSRIERRSTIAFGAGGHVFGQKVALVDFDSNIKRGTGASHSKLSVLGKVKWESSTPALNTNLRYQDEFSKRQRFWVGPLPVSVGGAVGGALGANLAITSPNDLTISGSATPYVDSYGKADAAIDIWLARAGIEGQVRIIKDSIPTQLTISYTPATQKLQTNLKVQNELKSLDGKISVYAKIRKLWGGWKKWSKTIFSWNGFEKTWKLIDQNITVNI